MSESRTLFIVNKHRSTQILVIFSKFLTLKFQIFKDILSTPKQGCNLLQIAICPGSVLIHSFEITLKEEMSHLSHS